MQGYLGAGYGAGQLTIGACVGNDVVQSFEWTNAIYGPNTELTGVHQQKDSFAAIDHYSLDPCCIGIRVRWTVSGQSTRSDETFSRVKSAQKRLRFSTTDPALMGIVIPGA